MRHTNTINFKQISYSIMTIACLISLVMSTVSKTNIAHADTLASSNEHLITIHDRGVEKSLITSRSTLREVFSEAHMLIDSNDIVEPGIDEKLTSTNYQVNIYRARPITIADGSMNINVMSAYQTPSQIVKHAGISLHDQDKTTMKLSDNIVRDGASLRLTIDRATPISLVLYGKQETVYTQTKTVADFLKDKSITLGKDDTVSVAGSASIAANMKIEIWRNGIQTVTQDEAIEPPVETIQDSNRDITYKNVQDPGTPGKKSVTYEIIMQNGVEVSRKIIQEVAITQPIKRVVVVGTQANLPAGSHEDWMSAAGIAASDYGYVNYIVGHEGGWEPCKVQGGAINCTYSGSAGYGMVQATPGGKMVSAGSDWRTNPITQLKWATGYAVGRYGSWGAAYNHWLLAHNW